MAYQLAAAVAPVAHIAAKEVEPYLKGIAERAALLSAVAGALVSQGVPPTTALVAARTWEAMGVLPTISPELAAVRPILAPAAVAPWARPLVAPEMLRPALAPMVPGLEALARPELMAAFPMAPELAGVSPLLGALPGIAGISPLGPSPLGRMMDP